VDIEAVDGISVTTFVVGAEGGRGAGDGAALVGRAGIGTWFASSGRNAASS
jgi:hypothetical protein